MKHLHCLLFSTALALSVASGVQAAVATFNFDNDNVGTSTTFTDTSNGVSATFSSPSDPGGFTIQQSIFTILTGNVLGDPGPSFAQNIPLTITFSQNVSAIDLVFATSDFGPASPFTLTAYEGNNLIGSNTQTGQVLSVFPEGEIAFSGLAFNQVVLSTPATDFAIDDVQVSTAPEPGSALLYLVTGLPLIGVSLIRGRRKPQDR